MFTPGRARDWPSLEAFSESKFRDWGVVQVGGNLPGPILQSAWFRATALAKVRDGDDRSS